ncbi:hypothetical protein QYM36_002289 [Artemia franciscana]|uniref:Uncharacterized protein n=1 Tax=Artemia franciscana TaxID=6661 RepID=A0AA88I4I5_ARTSF|nr:hypothetical protein QYM36_002289 [Artemia franciscana]
MEDKSGFKWTCPLCKVPTPVLPAPIQPAVTIQEITKVISQAMFSLQASLANIIMQSESVLRAELSAIRDKLNSVEAALSSEYSAAETNQIVPEESRALNMNLQQLLKTNVHQVTGAEKDCKAQKNNIVAYGIEIPNDNASAF